MNLPQWLRPVDTERVRAAQLHQAEIALIEAQKYVEGWAFQVAMLEARIERLRNAAK